MRKMKISVVRNQEMNNLKFGAGLKYTKSLQEMMKEGGREAVPKTFEGMNEFVVTPNPKLKEIITNSSFFKKLRKTADMFVTEFKEQTETGIKNYFNVYFKKDKNSERVETINFDFETENEDIWYKEVKELVGLIDENHEYVWGNKKVEKKNGDPTLEDALFLAQVFKRLGLDILEKLWNGEKLTKKEEKILDDTAEEVAETYSEEELNKLTVIKRIKAPVEDDEEPVKVKRVVKSRGENSADSARKEYLAALKRRRQ